MESRINKSRNKYTGRSKYTALNTFLIVHVSILFHTCLLFTRTPEAVAVPSERQCLLDRAGRA